MKRPVLHIVSVSSGKDSLATLLLALQRCSHGTVLVIFCDTGNEHAEVHAYLTYIEQALGVQIVRLKADFAERIKAKRMFIARDQRTGRDKSGRKLRWTNKAKRRALEVLVPTGNPFLDLCLWKGRFPARRAQFCTEELKRNMAVGYQLDQMDAGFNVVSWQGIRRDESLNRNRAKKTERVGKGLWIMRPIVEWTAADVFNYCARHKVKPNPLYLQGMGRVGCMPCINVAKGELREIAGRWPEHIERIEEWERLVGAASKRGSSTFLTDGHQAKDRRVVFADLNIRSRVEWAKTTRGGKQYDLLADAEGIAGCSSSYGLCDQWSEGA